MSFTVLSMCCHTQSRENNILEVAGSVILILFNSEISFQILVVSFDVIVLKLYWRGILTLELLHQMIQLEFGKIFLN